MSILQDPAKALSQISWYLDHQELEAFPGAFETAAGNLARQLLEQILFILAYFSGLPSDKYLRRNGRLHTAGRVLNALRALEPASHKPWLDRCRRQPGPVRRLVLPARELDRWVRALNEPSHYRPPSAHPKKRAATIRRFHQRLAPLITENDGPLLLAIANAIRSKGRFRVVFGSDPPYPPGVELTVTVAPRHLEKVNNGVGFSVPGLKVHVLPDDAEAPLWGQSQLAMLQRNTRPFLQVQFVTTRGRPIDLTSMATILSSLAGSPASRRSVTRRLRELGFTVQWS